MAIAISNSHYGPLINHNYIFETEFITSVRAGSIREHFIIAQSVKPALIIDPMECPHFFVLLFLPFINKKSKFHQIS